MASVAAYTYGGHSVVFVGTRSGHLKKVRTNHSVSSTADCYRDIGFFGFFLTLLDWEVKRRKCE